MIWIDTVTGTWGNTAGVRIIENPTKQFIESLEESSDSEIIEAGEEYGVLLEELID